MRERPILFSAPMVLAILDGRKTQTRRVAKLTHAGYVKEPRGHRRWHPADPEAKLACQLGRPSDRLWVREAFSGPYIMEGAEDIPAVPPGQWPHDSPIWYWADGEPTHGDWTRPRPSVHMPRWASRITLEITGVRIERLQDISEADARAEGVADSLHLRGGRFANENFAHLWWSIHGDGSWETNPWVWVVEFRRVAKEASE